MADINFLNTDLCTAVTFNTPTTDLQFIEYILEDPSKDYTDVDKYTLTTSTNCCSPGVTTNVAPPYQFVVTIDSCAAGLNTFKIDGINGNLVQSVDVSVDGGPFQPAISFDIIADELFIPPSFPLPGGGGPIQIIFRITTLSGFTYDIEFTFDYTAGVCNGVISNVIITYPPLPSNIVTTNAGAFATTGPLSPAIGFEFTITADNIGTIGNAISITLNGVDSIETLIANWNIANPANTATVVYAAGIAYTSNTPPTITLSGGIDVPANADLSFNDLFGYTGVDVPAGTYQIIFCEVNQDTSSTCIQNHMFIDCSGLLKCQVVGKWVMCIDSDVMDVYQALLYSNDCTDVVTYTETCALYETLTILIETDGCFGRLDDCNCTDATTIANKLSPIRYPSQTNDNPCTSC